MKPVEADQDCPAASRTAVGDVETRATNIVAALDWADNATAAAPDRADIRGKIKRARLTRTGRVVIREALFDGGVDAILIDTRPLHLRDGSPLERT